MKFDCKLAEILYSQASDGFATEQLGDAETFGWYGLFLKNPEQGEGYGGTIIREDSQGFVDVWFESTSDKDINDEWHTLEREYELFCEMADKECFSDDDES